MGFNLNHFDYILSRVTFSTVTLCFALVYAWHAEGNGIAAALIILSSLAARCFEKLYIDKNRTSETELLKKEIKALQDRVGRAELSMGMGSKLKL